MTIYTFTTEQGWKVSQYQPCSASYGVLRTPCLHPYEARALATYSGSRSETDTAVAASAVPANLVQRLTGQQLKFDYFSLDVLRQLLEERVAIRDRNRKAILSLLVDVSGDADSAARLKTPDGYRRRQTLERTQQDLERELRETDERLWKDTAEIREKLILAAKRFDATTLRSDLFTGAPSHDDQRKGPGDSSVSR